jgi:2'-5' RNA ligase
MASPTATERLFIALWPTPAVRRALHAEQRRWQWPQGVRLTPRDNLHLTLHFIGAVPAERVGAVAAGLAAPCPPFTLLLDGAAVWANACAVLTASVTPPPLAALHARLADALQALRLPVETRPLRPHVTLARLALGAQAPAPLAPLRWPVRGCVLVRSARGRYAPIASVAPRVPG